MRSSSSLVALFTSVSCLAFALGGCAANPAAGVGSPAHVATSSGTTYFASSPTHDVTSEYRPASMPQVSARAVASNTGPTRGARVEGVGHYR